MTQDLSILTQELYPLSYPALPEDLVHEWYYYSHQFQWYAYPFVHGE